MHLLDFKTSKSQEKLFSSTLQLSSDTRSKRRAELYYTEKQYFCPVFVRFSVLKVCSGKVKKLLEDSLDSILSPSPSVKIQIMGGKVGLRCKGKTLLAQQFWQKFFFKCS
jgi:hypothetical protein